MKLEWKTITVALLVGIFLGAALVVRFGSMGPHGFWNNPEKMHQHMMQKFTRELHLTADQQTKVSLVLDQTRAKIDELRQKTRPQFESIRDSADVEIRKILTPDQQAKFTVMSAEMKERFKKHHGHFADGR